MRTKIENETVKPAGITYPALFGNRVTGETWLQLDESGDAVCLVSGHDAVGLFAKGDPCQKDPETYTHIPGPLTITFNAP
jgi:hypothetical protein